MQKSSLLITFADHTIRAPLLPTSCWHDIHDGFVAHAHSTDRALEARAYLMRVCGLFASSTSGIVFNPSTGTITDNRQSAKDIDPYFEFQLRGGTQLPNICTHFTECLIVKMSKPGERAHDKNKILPWVRFECTTT